MRYLFIGFGNVAKEMCRIMLNAEKYPALGAEHSVIGIYTARHGGIENKCGLDVAAILESLARQGSLVPEGAFSSGLTALEAARTLDYDVLVELSALSIEGRGEPAISYIKAALERGKTVTSANKGPVAFAYSELKASADAHGAEYFFESAVMDGAPVFNLAKHCMKGATITGCSGILNSTTNFILSFMEEGGTLEEGIKKAQAAGIAEADPSHDVDGWDGAAKIAALANVLMDAQITPFDVNRQGISHVTPQMAKDAVSRGAHLKLVCRCRRECSGVFASVAVEEVPFSDVFSSVSHFGSALRIESDLMNPNTIVQENPGLIDTAYGVFVVR